MFQHHVCSSLDASSPAIINSPMSAFKGRRSNLGTEAVREEPRVSRSSSDLLAATGLVARQHDQSTICTFTRSWGLTFPSGSGNFSRFAS